MRKLTLEDKQKLLVKEIKAFDEFCKSNKIEYFAFGGTLLGAVRHEGFIPWDDDVDFCLKANDYRKLLLICGSNQYIDVSKRYKMVLPGKHSAYPMIKLIDTNTIVMEKNVSKEYAIGVYIDIFRMDYLPNDFEKFKKICKKQRKYRFFRTLSIFGNPSDLKMKLLSPILYFGKKTFNMVGLNTQYWNRKINGLGEKETTNYIGNLCGCNTKKGYFHKRMWNKYYYVKFEDLYIPIPTDYDAILKAYYGNYLELPPPEKRICHEYDAYYK